MIRLRWIEVDKHLPGRSPGEHHWALHEVRRDNSLGRLRADVWLRAGYATWHTWGRDGVGGENSDIEHREAKYIAMRCCEAALLRAETQTIRIVE